MNNKPTPDTLLAVIRAHCLDCSGGSRKQVRNCEITNCRLWPYRERERKPQKKKGKKDGYQQITLFDFMEVLNDER